VACGKKEEQRQAKPAAVKAETSTQAKAFIEQGVNYLNEGDIANAITSFDNSIKAEPRNPENYLVLGQVYLRLRNYGRAVDTFNAGTKVDANHGELFYFIGAANAIRYHMAEEDEAKQDFKQQGIAAAQRSVEIFIQQQDEQRLMAALALLKSLQENGDIGKVPSR
jgi:Tfp pilus assembly protein PilF